MRKYRVVQEKFVDAELGEVLKSQGMVRFTITFDVEDNFFNMQEVKEHLRKHKKKIQKIVKRYIDLTTQTKDTMFEKKEDKTVEAVLKRLGYL